MEIISLLSSPMYSEKNVGYIAASMLIHHGDDMMSNVINTVKDDLMGRRYSIPVHPPTVEPLLLFILFVLTYFIIFLWW